MHISDEIFKIHSHKMIAKVYIPIKNFIQDILRDENRGSFLIQNLSCLSAEENFH